MLDLEHAKDVEAVAKLRRAVGDLVLRSPLFGCLVLGWAIRVKEDRTIDTMCTDGRTIWYSPEWVHRKPLPSITFDVCHECLHVYGNHPARRGTRDPKIWGTAVDIRVAHDCLAIFRARGPWELDADHVPNYYWALNLSAEQIYDRLLKEPQLVPEDFKSDLVEPTETPAESEDFRRRFTQDLAQGQIAEETRIKGKTTIAELYGSSLWDRLEELKRCEVPWHFLLQGRLCAALGNEVATWVPPNRRWFPEIALPSRRGTQEDELVLGIDISGSIDDDDLARFRACILPAARRAKRTTVVTFDAVVRECFTTTKPETLLRNVEFKTGAHSRTDVSGVFEEVDKRRPSAIVILTDGFIFLPEKTYPQTHWVIKPSGKGQPWGRNYFLHQSW